MSKKRPAATPEEAPSPDEHKRAVLYARVSTDEQAEHGYSLQTQIEACQRYAESHGLSVVAMFKDDYTGTKLARESGIAGTGDLIVITGGTPLGVSGTTNFLKVQRV